jgi:hypothetical protein
MYRKFDVTEKIFYIVPIFRKFGGTKHSHTRQILPTLALCWVRGFGPYACEWTGFIEFDLAPIQQYEWIDPVHAKFEDEQKCLQGENDDIG